MGNIGRSSTGCGLCRKRKIKCDEGKPGCKKCAQIRKPCPGYPFSIELHLRPDSSHQPPQAVLKTPPNTPPVETFDRIPTSQPVYSQSLAHSTSLLITASSVQPSLCDPNEVFNPNAPKLAALIETRPKCQVKEEPADDHREYLHHIPLKKSQSPCPPPKYDVQHQATCFFLNLFSFQANHLYGIPILDFLPEMLKDSSENSAIQQAARAVARMTLADRYSGHDVRLQTGDEYLKALNATKTTMQNSSEAVKDESVVAVWLLGLYEAVNSVLSHGRENPDRNVEEEWQSHIAHIRGAMHLLRLRGMSQFSNPRSEKIFRIFKAAIQMRLFMLNSVTSRDFGNLELDVYADEHEFVPSETANKASVFFVRSARHLEKIKYALQRYEDHSHSSETMDELDDLLQQGEALDTQMEGWSKVEPGWEMMRVQASTDGTMWALYPSHALYYFYSFWIFLYWLRYLIARVKLFEALIEIVKVQQRHQELRQEESTRKQSISHFDFQIRRYTTIIQLNAGDLIGLTAYALGDVTNTGAFHSSASGHSPTRGWREVNVVAAMQLVIPLKVLQRSPHPQPRQKGAIDLAISHIGDGFRRQPVVV